jgi:hypothetical protein
MELLQEGSELKPLLQARLDLESCTSSCSDPLKPASPHLKWDKSRMRFGVTEVASIMTLVQFSALAITIWLGFRAKKAGVDKNTLFAWIFLTATLDLLVFNKVGSPQYELWVIGAAFVGVLFGTANWKPVVWLTVFSSGLSWLIFPIFYGDLLDGKPFGVSLLIVRNLAVVAILVWSNMQLMKLGKKELALK